MVLILGVLPQNYSDDITVTGPTGAGLNGTGTDEVIAMSEHRDRISVLVILLVVALGMFLVPALKHLGVIETFTVVAKPGDPPASPHAVAVSQWTIAAIAVTAIATLGWFCFRSLKRGGHRDDS
jgi:hypothetical protein